MIIIVSTADDVVRYAFADGTSVISSDTKIVTSDFEINDLNQSNSTVFTGVTVPADFKCGKYYYDAGVFTLNAGFVEEDETQYEG